MKNIIRTGLDYYLGLTKNVYQNILSRVTHKLPAVEWIVYEVTDACNSRCKHCNIWQEKPTKDMLTAKELETILKNDFFHQVKHVLLTGGEPVLKNDIKEIITAIHNAIPQTQMGLSTNALLPDRVLAVLKYAIDHNICLSVGISLDAIGEKHDWIRGVKGNFRKVDYLIRELIKLKEQYNDKMGEIVIGHTISNLTVDTLKEVLNYTKELKVGFLTQLYEEFDYYHNVNKDKSDNLESYQSSDNRALINEIKKLPPSFHHEILLYALRHRLRYKCDAMRTFFVMKCNGDVAPCLQYNNIRVGNLKLQSPDEIWHSEAAWNARKVIRNCKGCSNSWAANWSYTRWLLPFWKLIITLQVKKILHKITKVALI